MRVYHFNDWRRGNQFRTQSAKERRKASMLHGNRESFLQLARGLRTVDDRHTLPLPRIIPSSEKKRARTRVILVLYIYIYRVTFQPLQRLSRLPFERFRARLYFAAKLLKSRVVLPLRCACLFRFRRCGIFLPLFLCL